MKKLLCAAGIALSMMSFEASASTVFNLSSCNLNIGQYGYMATPTGFDEAICSFTQTTTSSLNISGFGNGMIDPSAHGAYGVAIDLFNGSSWTNIFTSPTFTSDTLFSSILGSTINFAPTAATELRLRGSNGDEGWTFHGVSGATQFTLNNVPEPASVALLGLGLTGLVLSQRRKQNAKKSA